MASMVGGENRTKKGGQRKKRMPKRSDWACQYDEGMSGIGIEKKVQKPHPGVSSTESRPSVTKKTVQQPIPKDGNRTKKGGQRKKRIPKDEAHPLLYPSLYFVAEGRRKKFQQNQCGMAKIGETCSQGDTHGNEAREEENLELMACRDKDSPKCSMYSSLKDGKDETRVLAAANWAALVAHRSFSHVNWSWYEELFSEKVDIFKRVKQGVLLSLIKFVLTIYDLEFFDRIVFRENINAECMKFLDDLNSASSKTTAEAILAIATREMDFGNFRHLLESDVGYILELRESHLESSEQNIGEYLADAHTALFEDVNMPKTLVDTTISVMKKISPLKRNCAMHLMMEFKNLDCRCVWNTLFHEFWRDIDVSRLCPSANLSLLISDILVPMTILVGGRLHELRHSMFSAEFPLLFSSVGDRTGDVLDVIEHADCERRWEGKRFIGMRHLLLGLLCSSIAESVLKFGRFRVDSKKESSTHPVAYEIYSAAEYVTLAFGAGEIKLEHLFLAIMVVNHDINGRPQWVEDLHNTINGLAVEEYIPVVHERMVDGLGINFGSLDTMTFVGNGIATEAETWNAGLTGKRVGVFSEGTKEVMGPWSLKGPLWNYLRPQMEAGKFLVGGCAGEDLLYDYSSLCQDSHESCAI